MYSTLERGIIAPIDMELYLKGRILIPYDRNAERTAHSLGRPVSYFGDAGGWQVKFEDGAMHFFSPQDWQYVSRGNGAPPKHIELDRIKKVALPDDRTKNAILIPEGEKSFIVIDVQTGRPSHVQV